MWLVLDHVLVQLLPEGEQGGPVQVALRPVELDDTDGPVGDVLLQVGLVPLEVEAGNAGEDLDGAALVGPALELPGLAHRKYGHHAVPFRLIQPARIVQN